MMMPTSRWASAIRKSSPLSLDCPACSCLPAGPWLPPSFYSLSDSRMTSFFQGPKERAWLSFFGLVFVIILGLGFRPDASIPSETADKTSQPIQHGSFGDETGDSESSPISPNVGVLSPSLARRQDYSCGAGRPCSNGACCGAGGFCGYGSTYCGAGCVSNCNAVAECGQYASPAGKTCPLNTCCSEFGFCGTTKVGVTL